MTAELDYVAHIRAESARFAAALAVANPSDRVPTCADWSADDLLWHLTEVQLFWAVVVRDRLQDPDAADAVKPDRPDDYQALLGLFDRATADLVEAITTTPGETEVWTWAPDQSVNFVTHWQAHEALMHRIDADLTIGRAITIDPALATDGVGTVLKFVHGDRPMWSTFTTDGTGGLLESTDTRSRWPVVFGRFAGTSPNTGKVYDNETVALADATATDSSFTVRGAAADLNAWLWGRAPASRLEITGDRETFARLQRVVDGGVP